MFVALWEYEVKPGCEERFENAYGPGGEWCGCSGATQTTSRLDCCVIPFVLQFTSRSISGIRARRMKVFCRSAKRNTRRLIKPVQA